MDKRRNPGRSTANPYVKPLIKSNQIKKTILIILVLFVFIAVFSTSTWSIVEVPEPDPDISISLPTPKPYQPDDEEPTPEPDEPDDEEPTPEPEPTPIPEGTPLNPLTGIPMDEEKIHNRPLAVVLNNIPEALPMNGVSDADIIYEVLVEGGLTRMLALYQDFTNVKKAGSIRSARHYTAEITESYDAIFISAGGSPQAYKEITARGIPHLDEVAGRRREIFFRDRSRIGGRRVENLHSVVTTGERVSEWLPKYGFRTEHEDDFDLGLVFIDNATPADGSSASNISVSFSAGKSTSFIYNADKKGYHLRQYNRDFIDANDNSLPLFTNVIILQTSITGIPNDEAGRRNVVTSGEGTGYFACGGKYVEINWSRERSSPFVYTHKDGTPLELGRGKTFICLVSRSTVARFE